MARFLAGLYVLAARVVTVGLTSRAAYGFICGAAFGLGLFSMSAFGQDVADPAATDALVAAIERSQSGGGYATPASIFASVLVLAVTILRSTGSMPFGSSAASTVATSQAQRDTEISAALARIEAVQKADHEELVGVRKHVHDMRNDVHAALADLAQRVELLEAGPPRGRTSSR